MTGKRMQLRKVIISNAQASIAWALHAVQHC